MVTSAENKAFAQFKGEYVESLPCIYIEKYEGLFKHSVTLLKNKVAETDLLIDKINKIIFIKFNIQMSFKKSYLFSPDVNILEEFSKHKIKLSLQEQSEWITFIETESRKALVIKNEIDQIEKELDKIVYQLYGLTENEIAVIEQA